MNILRNIVRNHPIEGKTSRIAALCAVGALILSGCDKKLEHASVEITDMHRHYYPVVQGEQLGVTYDIENTSDNTLFVQEIQTTCGCIVVDEELPLVILPKRTGKLHLTFNSLKNSGYVEHFIWLYGNFTDSDYRELRFDTNVVPHADYTRDYEQLWHEKETKTGIMEDFVDGKSTEKGYYTDEGIDRRDENRDNIQQTLDQYAP